MNAGTLIKSSIITTPLIPFYEGNYSTRIYLKPENLQVLGSYKIRGIAQVIEDADPETLPWGLSCASAGNMAQALAYAAKILKIPCKIFIPDTAPLLKKERICALGAQLIELPYQEIWQMVHENTRTHNNGLFIHPAYNSSLLKGYATIAEEIIDEMPDLDAIVIPFGVGGLSIGVGSAIRKLKADIAIYTCEPETAAPLKQSLLAKKPSKVNRIPSFVDAIGTPEVLPGVYDVIKEIIRDSLVIDLKKIHYMMNKLLTGNKLLCEGAAACSAAAAVQLAQQTDYKKIVCILSGGNVPLELVI
ncbi:MAG: hypothetical protein BGO90_01180 [Legionella sp. 40-6]|nr:pyridoxal-phosphate dependent enzyme [Legionella sp.]OJY37616.1 MAG: hypothetical protein BGO90_01180 [Legionella sp. 40-6]